MTDNRITVIDSPPGFGKTEYAIQSINQSNDDDKIIFITPLLTEVDRIIASCPNKHFVQPNPAEGKGSKSRHLISLVLQGRNIVSTHALFENITDDLIDALRMNVYTLYLDEVFETIGIYNMAEDDWDESIVITKSDMKSLVNKEYVKIGDDYSVEWVDNENMLSKYEDMRNLAERKSLFFVNEGFLLWSFPVEVFREGIFDKIFIMTHRFDSQIQALYYKYFDVPHVKYSVFKNDNNQYEIEPFNDAKEKEWKKEIKEKITIIDDPKLNRIGDIYYDAQNRPYKSALSVTWFKNNKERKNFDTFKKLSDNIVNYYRHYTSNKNDLKMWACFKEYIPYLKNKNLPIKKLIAVNARATNDYRDKTLLCYPVNRYTNPYLNQFFIKRNMHIDQDEYAVTELIQWIWRSAIRNKNEITIYIPSQRMRTLLTKFLNDEKIEF